MSKSITAVVCVIGLAGISCIAQAGDLEPPGSPAPTMVTLQEIFAKLGRPPDTCFDNAGRYAVCGDGTVKDNLTGLFWLANANCFNSQNWSDANLSAAQLADGQCGLTDGSLPGDWRLPTIEEWQVIVDAANANGCGGPTVPDVIGTGCCGTGTCAFSGVQSNVFWSATTFASNPGNAWFADLSFGVVDTFSKTGNTFVWPVRGGP